MSLEEAVRCLLREALGESPAGPIQLLTQLRSWGLWFNPVSFYFCHDREAAWLRSSARYAIPPGVSATTTCCR